MTEPENEKPDIDDTLLPPTEDLSRSGEKNGKRASFVLTFFILYFFWVVFSGRFDLFHLLLGVICCILVSFFSHDLLFRSLNLKTMPMLWFRFFRYIPWLLYQVLVANIHVTWLSLHPRMMELIDPQIMGFKSTLSSDVSLVTLANSITLTPGTITVYVSVYGDVTFHVIDIQSGKTLPWIMEARIAEIFGE